MKPRKKTSNSMFIGYLRWILAGSPNLYFSNIIADAKRLWNENKDVILEVWADYFPDEIKPYAYYYFDAKSGISPQGEYDSKKIDKVLKRLRF